MKDVAGIEKNLTVGSGGSSYKGVSDKDVKIVIGRSMAKNGLCAMPIEVDAKAHIERWEEEVFDNYQKKTVTKIKQSVFVECTGKYLLLHESGESQVIAGYGNGIDTQDKAAGKATTYSLKNALLYTFMVPTGEIDDTDRVHSDDIATPKNTTIQKPTATPAPTVHPDLLPLTDKWEKVKQALLEGTATWNLVKTKLSITPDNEKLMDDEVKKAKAEAAERMKVA